MNLFQFQALLALIWQVPHCLVILFFFLYFNSIHEDFFILYFSGIPEAVFDTEENEDRIYNLHFNYPFFLQIRYSNKQFFFFYFYYFFFEVLICVVYPDSYPQSLCTNVDLGELVIVIILDEIREDILFLGFAEACESRLSLFLLILFVIIFTLFSRCGGLRFSFTFPFLLVLFTSFLVFSFTTNGSLDATF